MWTIRQEQIDAFRQAALQQFEDQMVEHLKEFAPRHWKVMGEPDGRKVIRMGMERAQKYGFTNEGPVRFYIELMFMFGSYFDNDPQYPWVKAVLEDPEPMDQMVRADHLHDAMEEYVAQVSGPKHKYLLEAMRRLSEVQIGDVLRADKGLGLEDRVLQQLQQIHPEKCAYLGESVLHGLVHHGFNLALRHDMVNDHALVLMAALTFAVGHGFPQDPLYGWIGRRLDPTQQENPSRRAERLYLAATTYLKHIVGEGGKK